LFSARRPVDLTGAASFKVGSTSADGFRTKGRPRMPAPNAGAEDSNDATLRTLWPGGDGRRSVLSRLRCTSHATDRVTGRVTDRVTRRGAGAITDAAATDAAG
jgi:hypothetical protein